MIMLLIIVILIFVIPNVIDASSKALEKQKVINEMQRKKEQQKQLHDSLVQKYAKSDLTKTILTRICNGDYENNYPEQIVIDTDKIVSTLNGCTFIFDFKRERVPPLYSGDWEVKPSEAMAQVINGMMHEQYSILQPCNSRQTTMVIKSKYFF